jgi:tetratricopeptide (TPR) repeat protein
MIALASLVVLAGLFVAVKNTSFVTNSPVLGRFSNLSFEQIKSQGRYYIWPMAVEGIKERPLLGWGQENFNYTFNKLYNPAMYNQEQWFDRAHNIILDWGIAGGLLGLLSYLSIFVALLYSIWKKAPFSYMEKSILTGLVAGYFFQNLFVFDNIASYILFFSLLAFIHMSSKGERVVGDVVPDSLPMQGKYALGVLVVALSLGTLYWWNIRPIQANTALIKAIKSSQSSDQNILAQTPDYLRRAVSKSTLGRSEAREQIASLSDRIINSELPQEERDEFVAFAKAEVLDQAREFEDDARYRIIAGSFLTKIGSLDEALEHFKRASELCPGKQITIFQIGEIYLARKDYANALKELKRAYDLEPRYEEAKIIYLLGALYVGDDTLSRQLLSEIQPDTIISDDRIARALLNTGKYNELIVILSERIKKDPKKLDYYVTLTQVYLQIGQKSQAVEVLTALGENVPDAKPQADEYIRQIRAGEI